MGTDQSANHEWIELYNASNQEIDLTGWTLKATDGAPEIELIGTIVAQDYYLLERSSDSPVPDQSADLLFTGSLSNSGETLLLLDQTGAEVDRVDGSTDWELGGDNDTKETLQRQGSGWITAVATPGALNSNQAVPSQAKTTTSQSTVSSKKASSRQVIYGSPSTNSIQLVADQPELWVDITSVDSVGTQAPHTFSAVAYDEDGDLLPQGVSYRWNFGDGMTGRGQAVRHVYRYPGAYIVTVEAKTKRFGEDLLAVMQQTVLTEELGVKIIRADADSYVLQNNKSETVDISGWHVLIGEAVETLPQYTYLPAEADTTFQRKTRSVSQRLALVSPTGHRVWDNYQSPTPAKRVVTTPKRTTISQQSTPASQPTEAKAEATSTLASITLPGASVFGSLAQAEPSVALEALSGLEDEDRLSVNYWLLGVMGIIGIALLSFIGGTRGGSPPAQMALNAPQDAPLPPSTAFTIIEEHDLVAGGSQKS